MSLARQPATRARRWKSSAAYLVLLLLVGGFCFALGILLRITKDGKTTTVDVPSGSNARVSADGTVDVNLPGQSVPPAGTGKLESRTTPNESEVKVFTIASADAAALVNVVQKLLPTSETAGKVNLLAGEAMLQPVRFSVDARTNSIIATGDRETLAIVEALLERLDRNENKDHEAKRASNQAASSVQSPPVVVNPDAELASLRGQWQVVRVEKGSAAESAWQPYNKELFHTGAQINFADSGAPGVKRFGGAPMLWFPADGRGSPYSP